MKTLGAICKKKNHKLRAVFLSDFVLQIESDLVFIFILKNTVRYGLASLGTRGHTHRYSQVSNILFKL